jgi:hypothetical protein
MQTVTVETPCYATAQLAKHNCEKMMDVNVPLCSFFSVPAVRPVICCYSYCFLHANEQESLMTQRASLNEDSGTETTQKFTAPTPHSTRNKRGIADTHLGNALSTTTARRGRKREGGWEVQARHPRRIRPDSGHPAAWAGQQPAHGNKHRLTRRDCTRRRGREHVRRTARLRLASARRELDQQMA